MRRKDRRRRGAILVPVLLASFLTTYGSPVPPAEAVTTSERAMRTLINWARDDSGVRRLQMRTRLVRVARAHSHRMATAGTLFHNTELGTGLDRTGWLVLGENVGVGGSMRSLHNAFVNSSPHLANILDGDYRQIGVGVVWRRDHAWVTVVFWG